MENDIERGENGIHKEEKYWRRQEFMQMKLG
jgi:hypothetical protein